jgi:DNA-binding Lrp family transcriptional regulator
VRGTDTFIRVDLVERNDRDPGGSAPPEGQAQDGMLASVPGLSQLDRDLIHLLQLDGRASYTSLAQLLGTTEKVVAARVRALLSSGIIDITTVTDPKVLGYRYVAMIGVRTEGDTRAAVAAQLAELDRVDYVVLLNGRYDVLVEVFCRTLAELREAIDQGIRTIPGVIGVEVHPFLSLRYQQGAFQTARSKTERDAATHGEHDEFDEIDIAVTNLLNVNGREPFRAIADKVKISETQVRRRVARMQETGALRVMAIANPMSLGFEVVALLGIKVAPPTRITQVADVLSKLPSVTYVAICTGRYDILTEVVCTSTDDLLELMDSGIRPIPGIGGLEAMLYLELHYRTVAITERRSRSVRFVRNGAIPRDHASP